MKCSLICAKIGYHAWRSTLREDAGAYEDVPGFCKSAALEEIASHGYLLTPGRYVGAEEAEDDDEPFDEKVKRLTIKLDEQFASRRSWSRRFAKTCGG